MSKTTLQELVKKTVSSTVWLLIAFTWLPFLTAFLQFSQNAVVLLTMLWLGVLIPSFFWFIKIMREIQ